jgi:predicted RNase H-like HicB family nuclease
MQIFQGENGYWVGQLVEIPAVISQGDTLEDLYDSIKDALELYLEVMREENALNTDPTTIREIVV